VAKMGIRALIVGKRRLIAVGLDTAVKTATSIIMESAGLTVVGARVTNSFNLGLAQRLACAERLARGGAKATPR
jgi:hypothetical protein